MNYVTTRLSAQIIEVNRRIQRLSEQVQAAFPAYNQLIDAVVDAKQVVELLKPEEALVQVLLGENESVLFLVRAGKVTAYPLDLSEDEAAATVSDLRAAFGLNPDGTLREFDVVLAHQFYQQLLAPVSRQLEDVKHLVTVPTGPLLSLPFGLLVTEPPPVIKNGNYIEVKWLASHSAISLVPSVRSFVDLRAVAQASRAAKALIGFGNFVPYTAATVAEADVDLPKECLSNPELLKKHRQRLTRFGALPITELELKAVARSFPSDRTDLVVKRNFTEKTVQSHPLQDYQVVYFATHALLPSELECQPEPSLLASLSDPLQPREDGLLDAGEVLELRLDADLVVLSACNTGGPGLETGGESLSGLARAFFFAGARLLLVSHWPVEDRVTAVMMTRMFKRMQDVPGMGWAEALRAAQLSIVEDVRRTGRSKRSHPLFWGAFTVVGDGARSVSNIQA